MKTYKKNTNIKKPMLHLNNNKKEINIKRKNLKQKKKGIFPLFGG